MQKLTVIAALIATGCMSSTRIVVEPPANVPGIPAVVSVRAPDQETAEAVASDLLSLQVFGAIRVDDGSISDYDILAVYKSQEPAVNRGICGEPGALVLLTALSLGITPSCVIERGYVLELFPNGSTEMIRIESEYESTTWMGLHTLLLNILPKWNWGPPDDDTRRAVIQLAILAKRDEILHALKLGPIRGAEHELE